MGRLSGKVCVVTGASQGIGRGIARQFAREDAVVVVVDINEDGGRQVADELLDLGGSATFVRTDVGRKEDVAFMVATAHELFGRIDVLVNSAMALAPRARLEDKTDEMWEYVFRIGFFGVVWAMQAVFPIMRAQGGGRIINFDSRASDNGQLLTAEYNSTKAAVAALTRSAAAEWGKHNILCNSIAPTARSMGYQELVERDREFAAYVNNLPLGRVGDPEDDVAPVALFLASDDARYITGETFRAEGGIDLAQIEYFPPETPEQIAAWTSSNRYRAAPNFDERT